MSFFSIVIQTPKNDPAFMFVFEYIFRERRQRCAEIGPVGDPFRPSPSSSRAPPSGAAGQTYPLRVSTEADGLPQSAASPLPEGAIDPALSELHAMFGTHCPRRVP